MKDILIFKYRADSLPLGERMFNKNDVYDNGIIMNKKEENKRRKELEENGHTPSYIEWVIWQQKASESEHRGLSDNEVNYLDECARLC